MLSVCHQTLLPRLQPRERGPRLDGHEADREHAHQGGQRELPERDWGEGRGDADEPAWDQRREPERPADMRSQAMGATIPSHNLYNLPTRENRCPILAYAGVVLIRRAY